MNAALARWAWRPMGPGPAGALAWRCIVFAGTKTVLAAAGICFAVFLVFMELGIRASAFRTALVLPELMAGDVFLISRDFHNVASPGSFDRAWLQQARGSDGVQAVRPLYIKHTDWRTFDEKKRSGVLLLGVDPADPALRIAELPALRDVISVPDQIALDTRSSPRFGRRAAGIEQNLNGRRAYVGGVFTLGVGFQASGCVVTSLDNFARFADRSLDRVQMGAVSVAPGHAPAEVAARLARWLPSEVSALTREGLEARQRRYWLDITASGIISSSGVAMGVIVAFVILYQILATDILKRLPEYATLKALGYEYRFMRQVVVFQGSILGLLGYLPALVLSIGLYRVMGAQVRMLLPMPAGRVLLVLAGVLGMCATAATLAFRKVKTADPADLFA